MTLFRPAAILIGPAAVVKSPPHSPRGEAGPDMQTWKARARKLKQDVVVIALALRDPRVPWYARALGVCIVAYALSPIDLIPDFIPVLGYLDDLILVPLGLLLLVRLIRPEIIAEHRAEAARIADRPVSYAGAAAIVVVWFLALALAAYWARRLFVLMFD
jgi:uncharacterized membrane protein YkvA (DUF1232 family)